MLPVGRLDILVTKLFAKYGHAKINLMFSLKYYYSVQVQKFTDI